MQGLMMDVPLLIKSIVLHAERNHGSQEVVSVTADHPRHRYTYRECFSRARRLANALEDLGAATGSRIATVTDRGCYRPKPAISNCRSLSSIEVRSSPRSSSLAAASIKRCMQW